MKTHKKLWYWVFVWEAQFGFGFVVAADALEIGLGPLVFGWEKR